MEPLTKEQLFELFDKEVHNAVENLSEKEGVDHLVVFENLQMDSSCFGDRTALAVGPGCTYTLQDCEKPGMRLGSTPSTFLYPTKFWKVGS